MCRLVESLWVILLEILSNSRTNHRLSWSMLEEYKEEGRICKPLGSLLENL